MKTFQMTNPFTHEKEEAALKVSSYASDPAVMGIQLETPDGDPLTTATVNLGPDAGNQSVLRPGATFLDTNNNPEIAKDFEDAGLAEPYERWGEPVTRDSGWCSYPLYQFNLQKLAEYDPEGVKSYQDGYQAGFEKALPEVTGNMWFDEPDDKPEEDEEEQIDPMELRKEMADHYNNLSSEEYDQMSDEERSDLALAAQEEAEDAAWERSLDEKQAEKQPAQEEKAEEKSEAKPERKFEKLWVPYERIETKEGKHGKFDEVSMPLPGHKVDSFTLPHKKDAPDFMPDPDAKHKDVLVLLPKDKPVRVREYDQINKTSEKLTKSADEVIDTMRASRGFEKRLDKAMAAKAAAKEQSKKSLAKEQSMMSHEDRVKAAEEVSGGVKSADASEKQMGE